MINTKVLFNRLNAQKTISKLSFTEAELQKFDDLVRQINNLPRYDAVLWGRPANDIKVPAFLRPWIYPAAVVFDTTSELSTDVLIRPRCDEGHPRFGERRVVEKDAEGNDVVSVERFDPITDLLNLTECVYQSQKKPSVLKTIGEMRPVKVSWANLNQPWSFKGKMRRSDDNGAIPIPLDLDPSIIGLPGYFNADASEIEERFYQYGFNLLSDRPSGSNEG